MPREGSKGRFSLLLPASWSPKCSLTYGNMIPTSASLSSGASCLSPLCMYLCPDFLFQQESQSCWIRGLPTLAQSCLNCSRLQQPYFQVGSCDAGSEGFNISFEDTIPPITQRGKVEGVGDEHSTRRMRSPSSWFCFP